MALHLLTKESNQTRGHRIDIAEPEIIGIATVLVIAIDAPNDFETETLVEAERSVVRYACVARDCLVFVGDSTDELAPESHALIVQVYRQKEQISPIARTRESDELGSVGRVDDVRLRLSICVEEEAASLLEDAHLTADVFLEFPGGFDVCVVTGRNHRGIDADAHTPEFPVNGYNCTATLACECFRWRLTKVSVPVAFELREHTADVGVAATATTLEDAFAAVADGLAAAMCDSWPDAGERFDLSVTSESREALLFDYLDELIYQRDVRDVLPVDNEVSIDRADESWRLQGTARGVPLVAIDAREIKAVTYSEMSIAETDEGWQAYVVFDV